MTSLFETLRRLQRLSRPHRIAFLRSLLQLAPPRSQRHAELYGALKRELTMQLKFEMRTTTGGEEDTPVRLSPTVDAA